MTEVSLNAQFGAELKDAFKPVNLWVSNGIAWLDDIQQFYRERSGIEREYASKLSALCKKYSDRKAKKISSLSVGDTPTMTPGSLESASLTTWSTQLTTVESHAAVRDKFGLDLITQVADPLKNISIRYEELRKSHVEFYGKLEKEREASLGELKKVKGKYDGVCQEVENRRKKTESSFDYNKTKAQAAYQQQLLEMSNSKNTYIINIHVANKLKNQFYHEYVPEVLDSLGDLNETRVEKLNAFWSLAVQLEKNALTQSTELLTHLGNEIPRNNPKLDSMMFLQHNASQSQEPPNLVFEPSPVWHDDDQMITDESAKVFLRNMLMKSKVQAKELKLEAEKQTKEVEAAKRIRDNVRQGKDKRDEVDVVRAIFNLQEKLHETERKRLTAEVETLTILAVVGDLSLGARNHNFKSQTFKIPTNCDLCGERIWGLSAKGFDCVDCGYTCHSKCQMKVPAECPGEQTKEEKKKLKAERQEQAQSAPTVSEPTPSPSNGAGAEMPALTRRDTMNSLSSGYAHSAQRSVSGSVSSSKPSGEEPAEPSAAPSRPSTSTTTKRHRVLAPPPTQYVSPTPAEALTLNKSEQRGKMIYAYQAGGDGEVTVNEGQEIVVLEPDDGSGWMRVRAGSREGLVPSAYAELAPAPSPALTERPPSTYSNSSASLAGSTTTKKVGPAVAPRRGAKKLQYVEALYDYEARSDAEHSMSEGDRFVLVSKDSGDGWAEVEKGGQVKSVPANYIQEV
ncbi:actin polymerization protein Bzz1, putative [Talaromyces stipitatus ATCC 10500]|uniref:High osmolarity signaling protein SHO1 n=1 Tax=Talaromyces stipitatus (strain ATCC 10500 / CBS 375.48 / QM 6759 / NRRL 1006) TaxID=441959 RepID=B8M5F1_TALSN|nr:actin polymerization protein Bzz1, putative [Talaromyces stipitatus ATCC 10500]EED19757.1 actin polymerization protein Bzz1, putative [Talaromyces stipitatus ATCC 10500]